MCRDSNFVKKFDRDNLKKKTLSKVGLVYKPAQVSKYGNLKIARHTTLTLVALTFVHALD